MKAAPFILIIAGLVILVVFGLVAVVSFILAATSTGHISAEEAGPFIGGGCCSFVGLAMSAGGLIWWLITRQQKPPLSS